MSSSVDQYVGQRAELLANLVLTRRKDVEVLTLADAKDAGFDILVRLMKPVVHEQFIPYFGVEILGTSTSLPDEPEATKYANQRWKHRRARGFGLFPVVLFLFSVEGDQGYYSWVMKPGVTGEGSPALGRVSPLRMAVLNKESLDNLLDDVVDWFEAMAEILVKHLPKK